MSGPALSLVSHVETIKAVVFILGHVETLVFAQYFGQGHDPAPLL